MRWGNVLRAAVAVPVLGLVIAWPRIAGEEQALPDDRAVPVAGVAAAAEPAEEAPARDTVAGGRSPDERRARRDKRARGERARRERRVREDARTGRSRREKRRERRPRRPTPTAVPTPPIAPAAPPPAAPASPAPPDPEFGFER